MKALLIITTLFANGNVSVSDGVKFETFQMCLERMMEISTAHHNVHDRVRGVKDVTGSCSYISQG